MLIFSFNLISDGFFVDVRWIVGGGKSYSPLLLISGNIHHGTTKVGTDILPTI